MKHIILIFSFSLIFAYWFVEGTKVRKCGTKTWEDTDAVYVSNCAKHPCILKRKTYTTVKYAITPENEIGNITNNVYARILGLPMPFIGVNGTSACGKIADKETGDKVQCPLKPGKTYLYTDRFKILNVYPRIKFIVHWELIVQGKPILCFEVPARIV